MRREKGKAGIDLRKFTKYLVAILFVPSLLLNVYFFQRLRNIGETGTFLVVGVIDGDTLVLEGDQSIRLANINAPETEFCYGKEAKQRLEELVLNKRVRLAEQRKGSYDRIMAIVYQGDRLVNEVLLEEGLGRYDSTGTSKDSIMLEAAHRAQDERIGVYSELCTQSVPPKPKCAIKGNIDKHYANKVYHFQGCSNYSDVVLELDRGERWFCSEKEAEAAGFTKAETCYGREYGGS